MKARLLLIAIVVITLGNSPNIAEHKFEMDKYHSRLGFSVKHFGISSVEGIFKNFEARLVSEKEDFSDAVIAMTAEAKSIDTGVDMRDNDLRSDNFFDIAKYPNIEFKSTSFKKREGRNYVLAGDITIHGITKPISFDVTYNGRNLNPMSKKYSNGFTINGKLNRNDFKVGSGPSAAAVGDEVELRSNVEFIEN